MTDGKRGRNQALFADTGFACRVLKVGSQSMSIEKRWQ